MVFRFCPIHWICSDTCSYAAQPHSYGLGQRMSSTIVVSLCQSLHRTAVASSTVKTTPVYLASLKNLVLLPTAGSSHFKQPVNDTKLAFRITAGLCPLRSLS